MTALDRFERTFRAALESGQIGSPVAARLVVHIEADHGLLEPLAARLLALSADWMGSSPIELATFGDAQRGHLSTLMSLEGGQSALVSVGGRGVGPGILEAVVWGNRGTAAWNGDCRPLFDEQPNVAADLTVQQQQLLESVRESVRTQAVVHLGSSRKTASDDKDGRRGGGSRQPSMLAPPANATLPRATKPPFGVLLVAGDHTHQPGYSAALAADARCKLIGLTDQADISPRRQRLNRQLAERVGIPVLPDLKAALNRDDVDIVSICAEPMRRGEIVVAAARAGKHLYLDKPLAGSLEAADEIRAAVAEAGVVAHMWSLVRTNNVRAVKRALGDGRLGELTAVDFDLCFAKGHGGTAELGRRRREDRQPSRYELIDSKRELSNVGVYPLAALFWLTGKQVRRVFATTGNYFFREHQQNGMEDFGQMLLELEDGTVASISAGRTGWRSHRAGGLNRVYVAGTKQSAVFDNTRPRVQVWGDVEPWTAPERDPQDPMGMWGGPKPAQFQARPKRDWILPADDPQTADVTYFLDCIEAGRQSDVSAYLAAATTEVLLAGYRSAASGSIVDLPLPRES